MNKFLDQYPQFWNPKLGDKVRVDSQLESNYANRIGVIVFINLSRTRTPITYMLSIDGILCASIFYKEDLHIIYDQ